MAEFFITSDNQIWHECKYMMMPIFERNHEKGIFRNYYWKDKGSGNCKICLTRIPPHYDVPINIPEKNRLVLHCYENLLNPIKIIY